MTNSRFTYQRSPSRGILRLVPVIFAVLGLVLSSCNLPQSDANPFTSSQRQTEIAGILNPAGLAPTPTSPAVNLPPGVTLPEGYRVYITQQGDTLPTLALRFDVAARDIESAQELSPEGLLPPGTVVWLPNALEGTLPADLLLPDSEINFGPTIRDFDTLAFTDIMSGYLNYYTEDIHGVMFTGPEIVQLVAVESSINPRLLLALLEFRSGWVTGFPGGASSDPYPLGFEAGADTGLYKELQIAAKLLAQGFYGWRDGSRLTANFYGGESARLDPAINAGTAAIWRLFSVLYNPEGVNWALNDPEGFLALYQKWYGDPWETAAAAEPYLLETSQQPELVFPFAPGEDWSLTAGPHATWQTGTPRGAIDFAPIIEEARCAVSVRWVTAAAPGLVVRSNRGVVAIDLDGDGDEGTGWVLIYLHVASKDRIPVGTWLELDDPVGHPSCEGGIATGTHLHFTRKFNGEWLGVGGPLPLVIDGWQAVAGEDRYEGWLVRGEETISAAPNNEGNSAVIRED
jgi:murein DD-endopeptidase MepM/ murein hydrolase activator NlpD